MSTLLAIETAFLNRSEVKTALNLTAVKSLQKSVTNAQKKKFAQTCELSKLVHTGFEWFKSPEGKQAMQDEGIAWSSEEFAFKVFGWQKSFFYRVVKAGALPETIVETFNEKCNEAESEGKEPNRTLEGLLKFAKGGGAEASEGGEGEEGEGGAEVETREKVVFTMSWKREGEQNVALRVSESGEIKTNNSADQIAEAIAYLQSLVVEA
jgi:hypothetical protein